jgi:hypothetical protein
MPNGRGHAVVGRIDSGRETAAVPAAAALFFAGYFF